MNLFRDLNRVGKTILMVTHNVENRRFFERVVYLRDGEIEKDETTSQLQAVATG